MSELPLPPTDRHQAEQYREVVKMLAKCDQVTVQRGPVAITVKIYRDRRAGDLFSRLKILLDACQGTFYEHSSQIRELYASIIDDKHRPRVEVEVQDCREPIPKLPL